MQVPIATPPQDAQPALPTFSPLYKQIKSLLLKQLDAGVWKAGDVLPSEMELADRMNVSQGTVRKAIDELVAEHLLLRRQGKGTYVATHSAAGVQYRFLRLRPDVGERQLASSTVHSCKLVAAPALVAAALSLEPKGKVLQVERTLSFGGKAVVFETIYLQASLFAGLTAERMSSYTGPMYALFESEFGVTMTRAQEQVRAVAATPKLAAALGLADGAPLLQATRSSFSYNQKAVELRQAWYVTNDYYYWSELD
jgi:GntR family transcriptional regulator